MSRDVQVDPSGRLATVDTAPSGSARRRRLTLDVAAVLISLAGLVAAVTGAWFIFGQHPFHRSDGFAKEFGMTQAQIDSFNPEISHWVIHVSDQVGAVSLGWGLFVMCLAAFGVRDGQRSAWLSLWLGGLPTLLFAAFGELSSFGTLDTGSILSLAVLGLFLAGMLLPLRLFAAGTNRQ